MLKLNGDDIIYVNKLVQGAIKILKFIDDLAGALSDIIKSICYFIAGFLLVGVPLFIFAKVFVWIFH